MNTHFCMIKWLSFFPGAPEMPISKFSRDAEQNGKGLISLAFSVF